MCKDNEIDLKNIIYLLVNIENEYIKLAIYYEI